MLVSGDPFQIAQTAMELTKQAAEDADSDQQGNALLPQLEPGDTGFDSSFRQQMWALLRREFTVRKRSRVQTKAV